MNRHQLGIQTARQLRTTEHALDQALAESLLLGHQLVSGRAPAGFAASVGQEALVTLVRSVVSLTEARQGIIMSHDQLDAVSREQGVRWRLDGPLETKPARPMTVPLAAVA